MDDFQKLIGTKWGHCLKIYTITLLLPIALNEMEHFVKFVQAEIFVDPY